MMDKKEASAIWAFSVVFAFFLGVWYNDALKFWLWEFFHWGYILAFTVDILQLIAVGVFFILVYFHEREV